MIQTYRKLQRQRAAGEIDGGFTLIELLIVIVVLGILAAIVVFALGGVTGKSTVAACQSDAKTVGTSVAALEAENPTYTLTGSSAQWQTDLTGVVTSPATSVTTGLTGSPFLQSWPTGNKASYTISIADGTVKPYVVGTGTAATVISTTAAPAGDVLVTGTGSGNSANTKPYDATQNPIAACTEAVSGTGN